MNSLRVAGVCVNQTPMDWQGNFNNIVTAIEEAKRQNVNLVVFPELSISAYGLEDWYYSSAILEKTLEQLQKLADSSSDITFAVGLAILWKNALYNTARIIHNGKIQGFYAKQNLCSDGVYYESRWFKPWPNGLKRK